MAVLLRNAAPPFSDVKELGRECVPVYAFMWESAARDEHHHQNGDVTGGTCTWTVKGLAAVCSLGKSTVITALKKLLDGGYIQIAAKESRPYSRVWRVTHPKHLEAVRYAIDVMGLPSLKYNDSITKKNDSGTNRRSNCLASKESTAVRGMGGS